MTTEFKVGDVVKWLDEEHTVTKSTLEHFPAHVQLGGRFAVHIEQLALVRRASESQREGGFADKRPCLWGFHDFGGTDSCSECGWLRNEIEAMGPVENNRRRRPDPAPAQQDSRPGPAAATGGVFAGSEAAEKGFSNGVVPSRGDSGQLPQPAPMTRAARVLAGMMGDPYEVQYELDGEQAAEATQRNEAARLRMAKWSLDRPLERDPKKWALLTGPCHPVTGRPVRR